MLSAIIVEDEAPAARLLQRLLEASGQVQVLATASSCNEALHLLSTTTPEVLLLDIELGDGTGFDLLNSLPVPPPFPVIFCTAYDEFALQAFEFAAIDYLLKPITSSQIDRALKRIPAPLPPQRHLTRLFVEQGRHLHVLPVESIDCITSDRNYLILEAAGKEYLMRGTIQSLSSRLNPSQFARISRGAIARLDAIARIERAADSDWTVVLRTGKRIPCTRKFWSSSLEPGA